MSPVDPSSVPAPLPVADLAEPLATVSDERHQLVEELAAGHRALDEVLSPTTVDGRTLEIAERIRLLGGRCLDLENGLRLELSQAITRVCDRLSPHVSPTHHVGALDLALDMVDKAFADLRTDVSEARAETERHRAAAEHAEAMHSVVEGRAEERAARREGIIRDLRGAVKDLEKRLSATEREGDLARRATRDLDHLQGQLQDVDRQRAIASTMRDRATSQLASLRTERDDVRHQRDEASKAFKRVSREADHLSKQLQAWKVKASRSRVERDDARYFADALEVDLSALEDVVRELCDED